MSNTEKKVKVEDVKEHEVYISGRQQPHGNEQLCVEIMSETAKYTGTMVISSDVSTWDEATDLVKKHDVFRVPLRFHVWYIHLCWNLLPPRHEFSRFANITHLSFHHHPRLEHIDVTALPFLRQFDWFPGNLFYSPDYKLALIRITGLTRCKYLEQLSLYGMSRCPFILKLTAPFRNLQALDDLSVGLNCVNPRYPLELVASQSLQSFVYNDNWMLRHFKTLRSLAMCACILLRSNQRRQKGVHKDICALARAIAYGPIHDPSLIVNVALIIKRGMEQNSTPIAHAL